MADWIIRYAAVGREPQEGRGRTERDLVGVLRERLPDARIELTPGRIFLAVDDEGGGDAAAVLAGLHGITSWSPCRRCRVQDLAATVLEVADRALDGRSSFAVRVRRTGAQGFSSRELERGLGAAVAARHPEVRVDLVRPEARITVELRGDACFVCEATRPGVDRIERTIPLDGDDPRFLADQMLGRLAARLRMLGYDTVYLRDVPDSYLLRLAAAERRILLTRDRPLAAARSVATLLVEERRLPDQLRAVVAACGLAPTRERLFRRCAVCNTLVEEIASEAVIDRVPARVRDRWGEFRRCPRCDKVYWRGEHCERMLAQLEGVAIWDR